MKNNIDKRVVHDFGEEWNAYRQNKIIGPEGERLFQAYFHVFPWDRLPKNPQGMDVGCGSGRWAYYACQKKGGTLHCVEPAEKAMCVAKENLKNSQTVGFIWQMP